MDKEYLYNLTTSNDNIDEKLHKDILTNCHEFINKWYKIDTKNPLNLIDNVFNIFKISSENLRDQKRIIELMKEEITYIKLIKVSLEKINKLNDYYDKENYKSYDQILNNLIINLGNLRYSILYLRVGYMSLNPVFTPEIDCGEDHLIQSINIYNIGDMEGAEHLLRYTLNYLYLHEYRKYGSCVYEPIYYNGYFTHAWKEKCEISEFVNSFIEKDSDNNKLWVLLYVKKNVDWLIKFLTETNDSQFPKVEKNRYYFSFRNGIYNVKKHEFYPYVEKTLSHSIVSCKFFDMEFNYIPKLENWETIETKSLHYILDPQFKKHEQYLEICKFVYILFGRMLYDLGECDDWQVIPFFKGLAGTGKSSLLRFVIKNFYEACDVGILSNDCSSTFPIENLIDKKIFLAVEIDENFKLPQTQFQSMVSGEDVAINQKFKTPKQKVWNIPGAFSGNQLPGYKDNAGSLARRIIVFQFCHTVTSEELKNDVQKEISLELPNIIQKCNLAYQWALENYDKRNIWNYLPEYFTNYSQDLLEQTNTLVDFMKNYPLNYGNNLFITKTDFTSYYTQFCKDNNCLPKKLTRDFISGTFPILSNIKKVKIQQVLNPVIDGIKRKGNYIIGLDICRDNDIQENNDF